MKKVVLGLSLVFLVSGIVLFSASYVKPVRGQGVIYIRADGSVEGTDKIVTSDNVTYTFAEDIFDSWITVQRDDIVLDGAGYTLQGPGSNIGIDLSGRTDVTVKNTMIKNFAHGIYLGSAFSNRISGNTIIANTNYGIHLDTLSSSNIISENNIASNGIGIGLDFSSSNTISGNAIGGNGLGIGLGSSSSNTISRNNVAANNGNAIDLQSCSGNNIADNNITANIGSGIYSSYSSSNTVNGNNITTNNNHGIYFETGSSDNRVYHNNFVNSKQVYLREGLTNVWDNGYSSGGNYWSDYDGNDSDHDGIGDTPYVINSLNQDNYPLMTPHRQITGDLNGDGQVNILDIVLVALQFGRPPPPITDPRADVNNDGRVNILDITIVAIHFGERV